jgi:RNA polymerase sigma-70 factor (ECF subfamily)
MSAAERQTEPKQDRLPDAELVASARNGNAEALGSLYTRYGDALMAVAYRLLNSAADAEDVLHDVFVGLPEALRRYEERGALVGWLKRVTARVALTRMRDDRTSMHVAIDDVALAQHMADREGVMALRTAVGALPPGLRAVLVLKEIEGFTHAEIAGMLRISVGASEVRLHRALRALRRVLAEGER